MEFREGGGKGESYVVDFIDRISWILGIVFFFIRLLFYLIFVVFEG